MHLKKLKIGELTTPNNVFLAPLAGYTNAVFRQLCYDLGAGLTFTEMVSAKGLCYDSEKTRELLYITGNYTGIKACQLFGADPDFMQRAANSKDIAPFDIIDINMGCPMPKIFNNGEGSALLSDIPLAQKIIKAAKTSGKAVTVKFRIGLNEDHIIAADFAKACEDAGADMLTIHGRTKDRIYSGDVNSDAIAKAKQAVSIPVIANGGVFSVEDGEKLLSETGADGIALARGAMYNPWLFASFTGRDAGSKKVALLKQLADTKELYGPRFALVFMRKMAGFYVKGYKGAVQLRLRFLSAQSCEELKYIIDSLPEF